MTGHGDTVVGTALGGADGALPGAWHGERCSALVSSGPPPAARHAARAGASVCSSPGGSSEPIPLNRGRCWGPEKSTALAQGRGPGEGHTGWLGNVRRGSRDVATSRCETVNFPHGEDTGDHKVRDKPRNMAMGVRGGSHKPT